MENHLKSNPSEGLSPGDDPVLPACKAAPGSGSRRRRLWELDSRAYCPVVGVCLPIPVLRRIVNKAFHGHNIDTDYALHSGAVGECKSRTVLAEAMQRELEKRYSVTVRQAAHCKTTVDLRTWWGQAAPKDLGAALWATLTHARCTPEMTQQVLGEVHMLQHQVGAAQRADMRRLEALLDENAVLARKLARAQQLNGQITSENVGRLAVQQDQLLQLRARLLMRESELADLQAQLRRYEASVPELACRLEQADALKRQADRIHALERDLLQAQQENERRARLLDTQAAEFRRRLAQAESEEPATCEGTQPQACLEHRTVLCVGGRTANVPLYRQIIEGVGARFAHHDGGEEESLSKLDNTLAAADLVICQTGCISHNAYWRVKDHCKRTAKQCLFVENPGTASLKRALSELQPSAAG